MVKFMCKCYECAVLVEVPENFNDVALCKRHEDPTAVIIPFPTLYAVKDIAV